MIQIQWKTLILSLYLEWSLNILKMKLSTAVRLLFFVLVVGLLVWELYRVIASKLLSLVFQNSIYQIVKSRNRFLVVFGRCFTVSYSYFISHFLGLVLINLPFVLQIDFVTDQHHLNFIDICFFVQFVYPEINRLESALLGNVKDQ